MRKVSQVLLVSFSLLMLSLTALAQNAITGKVTDSKDGSPVAGVTVTVKGTRIATQTVSDGSFKISAPANAVLILTSVGYTTQEVNVAGKTSVEVRLVQGNQVLNEVVVVGYGTTRKKDLTGSVNVITAKDFQKGK